MVSNNLLTQKKKEAPKEAKEQARNDRKRKQEVEECTAKRRTGMGMPNRRVLMC